MDPELEIQLTGEEEVEDKHSKAIRKRHAAAWIEKEYQEDIENDIV